MIARWYAPFARSLPSAAGSPSPARLPSSPQGHGELWWTEYVAHLALLAVFYSVSAWLVIPRQSRNAVVWIMASSSFFAGLWIAGHAATVPLWPAELLNNPDLLVAADLPSGAAWLLLFTAPAAHPAMIIPVTLGLLLFPDGTLPSPRWRGIAVLAIGAILVTTAASAWTWRPASTLQSDQVAVVDAGWAVAMLAAVLSAVSLIARFRRSSGTTRQQLKWIVWGASIFLLAMLVGGLLEGTRYEHLVPAQFGAGVAVLSTSYGIAVAKYRLYDIDRIISRTLAYALVTALLGGTYVGLVLLLGVALRPVTADSHVAVAGSVLVVAAMFNPVRRRVQSVVDRRFNRARYNAQQTIAAFTARLQQRTDLEVLSNELSHVAQQTMQPTHVSLWIPPR